MKLFLLFSIIFVGSFELDGFENFQDCKKKRNACVKAIRTKQSTLLSDVFRMYLDLYQVRSQFVDRFGVLILRPPTKDTNLPVVVWLHDGAFLGGTYHDPMAVQFATQSNSLVFVLRLRHIPDVPIDAIKHDGLLGVSWAYSNAEMYGGDPQQISILGHGSGVYITSHVVQMVNRMKIAPLSQILIPFSFVPFEMTAKNRNFIHSTYDLKFWQELYDTSLPPFPVEEFRNNQVHMILAHPDDESHPLALQYLYRHSRERRKLTTCDARQTNPSPCFYQFIQKIKPNLSVLPTNEVDKDEL